MQLQPFYMQPLHDSPQTASLTRFLTDEGACFVQDLLRSRRFAAQGVEAAIESLEGEGRVLVRPHSSGDPHLDGVDLRIVALVQKQDDSDGIAAAIGAIETRWQEWLGEFLANHRCT